ncbi:MAG: TraB/GumN family protein [Kofleriaceae bacterium]
MRASPRTWLATLALAAAVGCRASAAPPPMAEHPLLWAAHKDGQTTYLLGTIHLGFDAERQLPPWVWSKLRAADRFAVETDLSDPVLMASSLRVAGPSLRDALGEDYWRRLTEQLAGAGGGGSASSAALHMAPFTAVSVLEHQGVPAAAPMDLVLLGEAETAGKEIVYLEPASTQVEFLERWVDVDALKELLDDLPGRREATRALIAAYVAGDVAALEALAAAEVLGGRARTGPEAEREREAQLEQLLYRRNAAWIAPIEAMHRQGGAMVAVGAMHLIGPRSVLTHLRERGYRVERVAPPN